MGGPAAIVYLPEELSEEDIETIEQIMNDRSWRTCAFTDDVLHVSVQEMTYEHGPAEVDALEITLGWRPEQQIQVVSFANSRIEWHVDLAVAAARLARRFSGRVMVLVDPRRYQQMASPSFEIFHPEQHDRF